MSNQTLFSLDEPITPSSERTRPCLWLKRLVILADVHSLDSPIQDIPFRRGLNIIQTRRRAADETQVVGHSVGKTLLVRLIRYSLGEPHFAVEHVRTRIADRFATAQVVAHWEVDGVDWIVRRPIREGRSAQSFAMRSDNWSAAIVDEGAQQPFASFLAAVSAAVLSGLSDFTLPRARRSPKWLDVLGWLARDYECGYRAPNEWRHADADSGMSLDRDDNSLILQWLAGLMSSEEIDLKHRHQGLLDERQKAKASRESAQKTIEVSGPEVIAKLGLSDNESALSDTDGLFAVRVVETADKKIESLARLRQERRDQSAIRALESEEEVARKQWITAEADVLASQNQIRLVKTRIETLEAADLPSAYAVRSPYEDCPYEECPMRLENRVTPVSDPAKDHHLTSLREELVGHQQSLPIQQSQYEHFQTAHADAALKVRRERERVSAEVSGIDQEIGRWQGYRTDAEKYRDARITCTKLETTLEGIDRKIEDSYQVQETVRQNLQMALNRLSAHYDSILKEVFGKNASGSISVDGKGLHPVPDNRLAPNGAALSTMTTVLAFDISSIAASIAGDGLHPRLLIHDSPREGDMEEPLFHRLFQIVRDLEKLFGDNEPSFQYIVTTTTPPPAELADEAGPYVRLTLDARKAEDRLMGASF